MCSKRKDAGTGNCYVTVRRGDRYQAVVDTDTACVPSSLQSPDFVFPGLVMELVREVVGQESSWEAVNKETSVRK
jgi:hypothetical protein